MQKIGLSNLLAPVSSHEFLNSYWPYEPLFIPASENKLQEIFSLPQLQDLESLVAARLLKVRACLPDFDDEYSSIHVEPKDALKAYRNKMTLVFDQMQTQHPTIAEALKNIRADLGLVTGGAENDLCRARSIAYATPGGCGTRLHFDANANFVIQIKGSKRWRLGPNESVDNPTERFTTGSEEMPAALEKQCHAPLIEELPEGSMEILMEPGCVLFVPRGYWHETMTDEDSLSLNFTFSQPTWADVFTKSLQEVLLQSPEWRELADGLEGTDQDRKNKALARFDFLVKNLASDLPDISGQQLLIGGGLLRSSEE
ncbi:JmjC domain-containing protein [Bdellovibrio svalbardensis]|uniref:Cupin-like domain-containing protein n=1 Tax=Bdellovibrio svalbardensis TaxID=2972972 RepID=A0ABT6DMD3_9BACT|nr:cupin domain-containing protein [Bdellovibrio svalbardensis]MDG0817652.1 cupin-like domain-containing protein [Bdellovibrio svalbardensis]